ncbi:MAG: Gfo/Idh/MocA family oxidoreductase, partial [Armatimonadota bacterium]|nr:Gfo/Idh/MocA family oxidoreductase [Armatimonadota bacterium]
MKSDKPRIGFVGVGSMGQCAHLRNYASLPDCTVVALAEPRPHLAQQVAAKYGVPRVYATGEAMLATEELDGIVAAQPFNRHGRLITPLYRHGIPIFTEKPLAASVEVGEQMLAALHAGGSWHMVGYHKRSDPATIYAKAEIERLKRSSELGALRYVRITMPPGDWIAGGFSDRIDSPEPVPPIEADPSPLDMDAATFRRYTSFVNYYIHQVNLLRHLLGEAYRVTYAEPSGVLLAAQSESGVAGVIEMAPYHTTHGWHEAALIGFERGYIKLELPAPLVLHQPGRVEVFRDPGGAVPTTVV